MDAVQSVNNVQTSMDMSMIWELHGPRIYVQNVLAQVCLFYVWALDVNMFWHRFDNIDLQIEYTFNKYI